VKNVQLFMNKVTIDTPEGCWLWNAYIDRDGYGQFQHEKAHRVAYEFFVGEIPPGLELDHFFCNNPSCVNPWHVLPVAHLDNVRRTINHKVSCKRGHLFNEENTYVDSRGVRHCRACNAMRAELYRNGGSVK